MSAPLLSSRIAFDPPGQVIVRTGKVELGQGVVAALTRVAATTLDVACEQVVVPPASTDAAPNEGHTAGSLSIQTSGMAAERACRQARAVLIGRAAASLGARPEALQVDHGRFLLDGKPTGLDYWSDPGAIEGLELAEAAPAGPLAEPPGDIARTDLRAKITSGGFIHDLAFPDMLHARVVRPPEHGALLETLDEAAFVAAHPHVQVIVDGAFVAVACALEEDAVHAAERLREHARWKAPPEAPSLGETTEWLPALPSQSEAVDIARAGVNALTWHEATYSRPAIAHGSVAPSCAVAQMRGDRLRIWSTSQNIFALRDAVAEVLALDASSVVVEHVAGAGCYGHNGADDVALDAAIVARRAGGRAVRLQWSREEELGWSPAGAPMVVHIAAGLEETGRVGAWKLELWSAPHARRPGLGGPNLLSAALLANPTPLAPAVEIPLPMGGGNRNAQAFYDFPDHQVISNFIADPPIRTSSLRGLGAHANTFAIESMMDELAELAGADPLAFRLNHLSDLRARRVLEAVAEMSAWGSAVAEGRGRGLAAGRYKNTGGYAAIVVEVAVEDDVVPTRVWCAVDVGRPISRDGVVNQVEGGIVQSLSWALREAAPLGPRGVAAKSWKDYPVLKFSETPEITVLLVGDPENPPVGAGEIVVGPTSAAAANAVAQALGLRLRQLPLTRDRIVAAAST